MKKLIALLATLILCCSCNAQIYRIQKAQAFYTVSFPGMAMKDENGNTINPEPIIDRFIYIECRFNGKPKIDSVFYNSILFTAAVADKAETAATVGIKSENGNPVKFIPKKGNKVWKIYLTQIAGNTSLHEAVKKIIIKGRLDKTKFTTVIYLETQLSTPDRS
jgi:type 1 fimbria pilin